MKRWQNVPSNNPTSPSTAGLESMPMPNRALRKVTKAPTVEAREAFLERCRTFSTIVLLHVRSSSSTSMMGANFTELTGRICGNLGGMFVPPTLFLGVSGVGVAVETLSSSCEKKKFSDQDHELCMFN